MSKLDGRKECHLGPKLVISSNGLEIYGASLREAEENYHKYDLIISLDRLDLESVIILSDSNIRTERIKRLVNANSPERIRIKWLDMSVPNIGEEFWDELVSILKKRGKDRARRGKMYKVLVHCIGGHGRTGTLLAILANKILGIDSDLVEYIRANYCPRAIETKGQILYISSITNTIIEYNTHGTKDGIKENKNRGLQDKLYII